MSSLFLVLQSKLAAHLNSPASDVSPGILSTPKASGQLLRQTGQLRRSTFVSYSGVRLSSTTVQLTWRVVYSGI